MWRGDLMADIHVNPNRMELMRLKKSLATSRRGHKLMKDKLDELLKVFLARVIANGELREQVEERLEASYRLFAVTRAQASASVIDTALMTYAPVDLISIETKNIMSVEVPEMSITRIPAPEPYSLALTPALLDSAVAATAEVFPLMLELAAREKAIELLAQEIERTRRRVNALEHVLIPQQEKAIRGIVMKLDEIDRSERTRLMKVKEMLEE